MPSPRPHRGATGDRDYRRQTIVSRPLFFSSTFRDLHAERDLLRNDAFLELNERLRGRRHELNVVDLRQGVEVAHLEDEAARELAILKVCLDEIERTRPFLIGLLGDRYGWVPPPERMAAAAQAAGFAGDLAGRSVTELELTYAFLANPEQRRRSHVFIRELDYAGMPEETRALHDERFAARGGTEAERQAATERWQRLEALKERLRTGFPDRVHTYHARWDAEAGRVTGLEELRQEVIEHLGADLDEHTARYERQAPRTWQEADVRALEDFALERTRHYVERPTVTGPALDFALAPQTGDPDHSWGLCLTGEPGLGKSALFARLYQELRERQGRGEVLVLPNAAGIGVGSGQVDRMLRRWIGELARFLGIEDPVAAEEARDSDATAAPDAAPGEPAPGLTTEEIEKAFASLLGRASVRIRVVLLLDALDQFERTTRGRYLTWLPRPWPDNARLLATAIPGTETESLPRDGRRVELRPVPPIAREEARKIAHRVFRERYHRPPNERALEILLDKTRPDDDRPAHANPLWLELVLQEINLLEADDYERAERELGHLPPAERIPALLAQEAESLAPTVRGAYGELLGRAERTFGEAFTRAALSFIALGRAGWREGDLRAVVPAETDRPWDELAFAGVRRSLGHHLVQRGELGLWDCFHAQLRETAMTRYLDDPEDRRRLHGRLAAHLDSLPSTDPLSISETMIHLVGLGDRAIAARHLAERKTGQWRDPLGRAALEGSVSALIFCFDEGEPSARERLTDWLIGLLESDEGVSPQSGAIANIFIFELGAALALTGSLEQPRHRTLRAARATLDELHRRDPQDTQTARDLSVSYERLGGFYLRRAESGDAGRAHKAYRRFLEIAQRLYQQNPQDAKAARDLSISHERLGDFYMRRGESGDADRTLEAYQRSLDTRQRLSQRNPQDAQAASDLSVSYERLGDFYQRRGESGDAGRALQFYKQSLETRQRLHQQNPQDARVARSLTISLNKLGDFYQRRGESGDAGRALQFYKQSLEIRQRLHHENPQDVGSARDLSLSLNLLGDFYLHRGESGDAGRALEAYRQSLDIRERLCQQNPRDAEAARDLSLSLDKLGGFYLRRGDADRALQAYQKSLEIAQRLCRQNPRDAEAARDLWLSLIKLGDFYLRRGESGDADRALQAYQKSLEIARRLCRQNPRDARATRDLSVSHERLGDLYLRRDESGDTDRALAAYQQSLEMDQRLHQQNPQDARASRDLSISLSKLGDLYLCRGESGDDTRALEIYQQSLEIDQRLYQQNPRDAQAARDLSVSHERLGDIYLRRGESGDADRALQAHLQSQQIRQRLYQQNPQDAQAARDLVVSMYRLAEVAIRVGDQKTARMFLAASHKLLRHMASHGMSMDPPMRQLLEQLDADSS